MTLIRFRAFIHDKFGGSSKIYHWNQTVFGEQFQKFDFQTEGKYKYRYEIGITKSQTFDHMIYVVSFANADTGGTYLLRTFDVSTTLKIYNTIVDVIRYKIKPLLASGDRILFEPADFRTAKLYERLGQMIAKEVGGTIVHTSEKLGHTEVIKN